MKHPGVTFIIPAYNAEKFLAEAVESVRRQSVEDWEMIIVDDCSSDTTLSIAREYAMRDSRIKVISMESQSGGAYYPRKKAIEMARTEIVAPLDADDAIGPNYLRHLLDVMESEDSEAVYPVMYYWEGNDISLKFPPDPTLVGATISGHEAMRATLDKWRIHCNGGLVKKSVYQKAFKMAEEEAEGLNSYFDEFLTRCLLFNCRRVSIVDEIYYFRNNPDSITRATDIRAFGFLDTNARLRNFVRRYFTEDSEESRLVEIGCFIGIFDAMRQLRKMPLHSADKDKVEGKIRWFRNQVESAKIKSYVSPRYMALLRLPYPVSKMVLTLIDRIKGN